MTKGNWKTIVLDFEDYKQITIVSDAINTPLAHLYLPDKTISKEDVSNAKLMANSKGMYELLNSMQLQFNQFEKLSDGTLGKIWFDKWAAIKKDLEKLDS